ncbi:MAG TPA: hypothetical protein VMV29_24185 [Ktedonobacterales bacterium]|nr:hypothetical protein [Ktedonobacterales bacterium]
MNPQPATPDDHEALRKEIQAAIAAGREVGPEMDQHLVDSVLEHYRQEQASRERALARIHPQPAQPPQRREFGGEVAQAIASNASMAIVAVAGIAAFVALLIFAPDYWWVIFFLPWLLGALGWNRWGRQHSGGKRLRGPVQGPDGRQNQLASGANSSQGAGQDVEIV